MRIPENSRSFKEIQWAKNGVYIHPTAIVEDNVRIGKNVRIEAYSRIGGPPEHREYWDGDYMGVTIGDNVVISNHVTIDAGCTKHTEIGNGCILLKGAHCGHDSILEEGVTLSCYAIIGGYSVIKKGTNVGLGAICHQNVTVPENCMIGANSFIGKTTQMEPGNKYVGVPAKYLSPNIKK